MVEVGLRFQHFWLEAMRAAWQGAWLELVDGCSKADDPDEIRISSEGSLLRFWATHSFPESEPKILECEVAGMASDRIDITASLTEADTMGMVRSIRNIDGTVTRRPDGTMVFEKINSY